jgi:hypothetical protein
MTIAYSRIFALLPLFLKMFDQVLSKIVMSGRDQWPANAVRFLGKWLDREWTRKKHGTGLSIVRPMEPGRWGEVFPAE